MDVEAKMRLLVAMTLLLSVAFSGIAMAKLKCKTHTLNSGNDSVAAPGAFFFIKNIGPNPVVLVIDDGEFMTLGAGKATGFAGDKRFDYYVRLAAPGDKTTIEFCK